MRRYDTTQKRISWLFFPSVLRKSRRTWIAIVFINFLDLKSSLRKVFLSLLLFFFWANNIFLGWEYLFWGRGVLKARQNCGFSLHRSSGRIVLKKKSQINLSKRNLKIALFVKINRVVNHDSPSLRSLLQLSKFESVRVWDSVNFPWITVTLTDSNLEWKCQRYLCFS